MYNKNKIIEKINHENIKIYRYIDFSELVDILESNRLFFPSAYNLSKSDQFEGLIPKKLEKYLRDEKWNKYFIKNICINSWHINDGESDAMWKLYSKIDDGVAIQSTFKQLSKSINKSPKQIYIEKVKYIDDHNTWTMKDGETLNVFIPFILKKKCFEYENELRALTLQKDLPDFAMLISDKMIYELLLKDFINELDGLTDYILSSDKNEKDAEYKANEVKNITTELFKIKGIQSSDTKELLNILIQSERDRDKFDEDGIYIEDVDPNILIEKIYVSPGAKPWFTKLVKSVLDRYNLNKEVRPSAMAKNLLG